MWTDAIDSYCERTGPDLWAEPINALTNLAFVLGALWVWPRVQNLPRARLLAVVLFLIGIGSALFHTFAQRWAALADVLPILMFILIYIYAANRDFWNLPRHWAGFGVVLFFPYAAALLPVLRQIPGLGDSAGYVPVALLILLYAIALLPRLPDVSRGLAIGAIVLGFSILARSLDATLCERVPMGTHFLWHLLNAAMLTWMIEVYRAHMLAGSAARG